MVAPLWLLSFDLLSMLSSSCAFVPLLPSFLSSSFASRAADEWFSKGKLLPLYVCSLLQLPVAIVDLALVPTARVMASVLLCPFLSFKAKEF